MIPLSSLHAAEGILNLALHMTLVLILGWLFMLLIRRRGAPVLSGVCLASLLIVLAVPFLSSGLVDWGLPANAIQKGVSSDFSQHAFGLLPRERCDAESHVSQCLNVDAAQTESNKWSKLGIALHPDQHFQSPGWHHLLHQATPQSGLGEVSLCPVCH